MATLKFSLRLNSPAFAGAVQRGTKTIQFVKGGRKQTKTVEYFPSDRFGLRVPAVRGILEFWYRALCGAKRPQRIYEHQGRVFGSTELGQGLSLRYARSPEFESGELVVAETFKEAFLYLGYGPIQRFKVPLGGDRSQVKCSSHSPSGWRDAILLSTDEKKCVFWFVAAGTERQKEELRRALILLHLFGGIGSRSRRGWGSVRVEIDEPTSIGKPSSVEEFDEQLLSLWEEVGFEATSQRPRFSAFGPGSRVFRTPAVDGGYGAVLQEFYDRFRVTRLWREFRDIDQSKIAQQDHDLEWEDMTKRRVSGLPKRLAFGMPYSPRFRKARQAITYAQESQLGGGGGGVAGRRASPLFLKVHRLANGQHFGTALLLNGTFLGTPGEKIGAAVEVGLQDPPDSYEAIHEFLSPTAASPSRDRLSEWTEIKLPGI